MPSKLLNETVGFTLYMPTEPEPGEVLPVIYWLHGKGGNETRGAYISGYLDEAIARNKIRPTAMVLVNGGLQSFYSDTYDGEVPVESMIMQELIPYVEKQFPVGRQRHNRLIEGYSMGGFGALKLASKYPDKFASVAIFGAALLSEEFLPKRNDQEAYERVFDADPDYFIKNTPSYWLAKNAEQIRALELPIRMRIGTSDGTRRYNFAVAEDIEALGLSLDFGTFEGVRHAPRQYYDVDEYGSFAFHEANMASRE
jgi:endo-1,4-beta-xylanase